MLVKGNPAILSRDLTPHSIFQPHLSLGGNLDIASKLLSIGGSTNPPLETPGAASVVYLRGIMAPF